MTSSARRQLQETVLRWKSDPAERYDFHRLLSEILFHADVRFKEYLQYRNEGEFPVRLRHWLDNVSDDRHRRLLFRILEWLIFIDQRQMASLYRDAYRRIIVPWITLATFTPADHFSPEYDLRLRELLRCCALFSITESFDFPRFEHINDLHGLPKPSRLGEKPSRVRSTLPDDLHSRNAVIVLEDFVGSGNQAKTVLTALRSQLPAGMPLLFVPLLILEHGVDSLTGPLAESQIDFRPVFVVPKSRCVGPTRQPTEPAEFPQFRILVQKTARRVLRRLDALDDPPKNAFGYTGCGALLVTCHNTPNNTLPLIHHRAPAWSPLFRRTHHSREGLS